MSGVFCSRMLSFFKIRLLLSMRQYALIPNCSLYTGSDFAKWSKSANEKIGMMMICVSLTRGRGQESSFRYLVSGYMPHPMSNRPLSIRRCHPSNYWKGDQHNMQPEVRVSALKRNSGVIKAALSN